MSKLQEAETTEAQNKWDIRLALWFKEKMASYIKEPAPVDPEKAAKRNRQLVGFGIGAGVAAGLSLGLALLQPILNDEFRNLGVTDPVTQIKGEFYTPNRLVSRSVALLNVAELSNPYDVAAGGRIAVINDRPGAAIGVHLSVLQGLTEQLRLGEDQATAFLLVADSEDKFMQEDSEQALFLRSEQKRVASSSIPTAIGTRRPNVIEIAVDPKLHRLNPDYVLNFKPGDRPLLASPFVLGGGPTTEDNLGYDLSADLIAKVISLSNHNPDTTVQLDPANPPANIKKLGEPITVSKLDKGLFAKRKKVEQKVFIPTVVPTFIK